jgi:hypothetical protein
MEATKNIARSRDFRRISDFDFGQRIKDIILSTTSDPSLLILWSRRADYYNSPQLLASPLECSLGVAELIIENMDRLGLLFHESHPARFFRTVLAVITNELPGICNPDLYERQVTINQLDLDFAFGRMNDVLSPDEFDSLKRLYSFETNQPQYYSEGPPMHVNNFLSQCAISKLARSGDLYLCYRRSFREPE